MGEALGGGAIMGGDQAGEVVRPLQREQERDQRVAVGWIQSGGWFVEEQDFRAQDQRTREGHALAFAAGEAVRVGFGEIGREIEVGEHGGDAGGEGGTVEFWVMVRQPFGDDRADCHARRQAGAGVLEQDLQIGAAAAQGGVAALDEIIAIHHDLTACGNESGNGEQKRGFAGAGGGGEGDGFAGMERQIERREVEMRHCEVFNRQDRGRWGRRRGFGDVGDGVGRGADEVVGFELTSLEVERDGLGSDLAMIMGDEEGGQAAVLAGAIEERKNRAGAAGVERGGGFIGDQQERIIRECDGECGALAFAAGETVWIIIAGEPDFSE